MPVEYVGWGWETAIDFLEDWGTPEAPASGDEDLGGFIGTAPAHPIEAGDLLIVTLMMYVPSGSSPSLTFPYSSGWSALSSYSANDCFVKSWYNHADGAMVSAQGVDVDVHGFSAPVAPDGGSTDGGVVWLHVFRTVASPIVAYQAAADDSVVSHDTGVPTDEIIHTLFSRRLNAPSGFQVPTVDGYGGGIAGSSWESGTAIITDNAYDAGSGFEDKDAYAVGFHFGGNSVTWDLSVSGEGGAAFGAAGGIIQGIKVGNGGGDGGGDGGANAGLRILFI